LASVVKSAQVSELIQIKNTPAMMRTGRNAMRSAGIDARNGALGKRSSHCVDLLSPRILPTHANRGKAIVRPIVRPLAS